MKISLLKEREDFKNIFIDSLSSYLLNRFDWQGTISTEKIYPSTQFLESELLNIIYPKSINRSLLSPLTQEFRYHKNAIRHLLQSAYTKLAVRFPFEQALKSDVFYISGADQLLKNCVFIPGNHSIRVINTHLNICTVFAKEGFDKALTITDAKTRIENNIVNAPKIFTYDFSNGWYDEERIIGLPLNRESCPQVIKALTKSTFQQMAVIYETTYASCNAENYAEQLINNIDNALSPLIAKLSIPQKNQMNELIDKIRKTLDPFNKTVVFTALSHGDLQPANILFHKSKLWIIDWEYSAQRNILYDTFIFYFNMREKTQLANRLNNFDDLLKNSILDEIKKLTGELNIELYLYISILEDLYLKICENSSNKIDSFAEKLMPFVVEYLKFINKRYCNEKN